MKTSDNIDQIIPALIAFQAEVETASKDSTNPHFKSSYADLTSVWAAVRPHLAKNNLAIVQAPSFVDGRVVLTTRIFHKTGQWIESELSIKPQQDTAQAVGSCITYERRYVMAAMLGVVADDDDDGNAANGNSKLFTAKNKEQAKWLEGFLNKKQIAKDVWPSVFNALEGKDFKELDAIIKKVII